MFWLLVLGVYLFLVVNCAMLIGANQRINLPPPLPTKPTNTKWSNACVFAGLRIFGRTSGSGQLLALLPSMFYNADYIEVGFLRVFDNK